MDTDKFRKPEPEPENPYRHEPEPPHEEPPPHEPGYDPQAAAAHGGMSQADERLFAMLCHLTAFAGYVVPFGNFVVPLIIWMLKKDESLLVDDQGRESLNFQISLIIYAIGCVVLAFVVIGIFLAVALAVFSVVVIIMASIKAYSGEAYRYPLNLRLIPPPEVPL